MPNRIVLTGPPGSGKTTLIQELQRRGITCVPEFARRIIRQQRAIGGSGVFDKDPALFLELMLSCALEDFDRTHLSNKTVVFDRGIPDCLAYAELFGTTKPAIGTACQLYRYEPTVFYAPPWAAIYRADEERKMPFEDAAKFGARMAHHYSSLGYVIIDLPFESVERRAQIVLNYLSSDDGSSSRNSPGLNSPSSILDGS